MKPHQRKPVIAEHLKQRKEAQTVEDADSFNSLHPSWRLTNLQLVDPYGWHALSFAKIQEIRAKLAEYEKKDWNEILIREKKRNKSVLVGDLKCPKAKKWLADNMPDQEEIWSLRLAGAERIWGIYSQGVFSLIWWDPNHLIWEMEN